MAYGVLMVRDSRRYDFDNLRSAYVRSQFAEIFGGCLGSEIVIYQSRFVKYQPGYFAVAILLDADISVQQPGYISLLFDKPVYFKNVVPVQGEGRIVESYVRNDNGGLHGRRFAEDFRMLSEAEFVDLVSGQYSSSKNLRDMLRA